MSEWLEEIEEAWKSTCEPYIPEARDDGWESCNIETLGRAVWALNKLLEVLIPILTEELPPYDSVRLREFWDIFRNATYDPLFPRPK